MSESMSESMGELIDEIRPVEPPPAGIGPSGFVTKIAGIFATRVVILGVSILTSLIITRLLVTTAARGSYVAVVTLPGMLLALGMFGLPNAVNYFAGRGSTVASLIRASLIFTATISVVFVGLVWLALPVLERTLLQAAPDYLLKVILVVVPVGVLTSLGGTLLYGRQQVRVYNAILLLQALGSLTGAIVLVGILRLGVNGAVAVSVCVSVITCVLVMAEVARLHARDKRGEPASLRSLVGYGVRLYPASLSGYFNYRADNNIIQAVAPNAAVAQTNLGLYSWAVTMAEVVFLVPESVASMFLPRVAGSSHEEASAMLGRVARVTLLISALVALMLIPAAYVGVHLVLPKYADSLPAFLAILPGVVALSLAKVMTSYVGGRGRPGPASVTATIALIVNVPLNIALIPWLGIVGASLSSVASYTVLAVLMTWLASRMSGQSIASLCIPRRDDAALLLNGAKKLARHLVGALRARSAKAAG